VLKWDDTEIILIEDYPCNSKKELETRERYYIESITCVNKNIPTRPQKEYKKMYKAKNKEAISAQNKIYTEKNKEKIKNRKAKHYQENITRIRKVNQLYRDNNKGKRREYYDKNKQTILDKKKEIVTCECGQEIRKDGISTHKKSTKHITQMNLIKNTQVL
jgi:hypothetical protein